MVTSKRQMTVADSTTVAETITLYSLVKEMLWVWNMMTWAGYEPQGAMTLWCDNSCTVRNSGEGAERNKTKHMDIKYMFIQDIVRQGLVEIKQNVGDDG